MTTTTEKQIAVGDVYLIVPSSGDKPVSGNVSKVTKTQFRVTTPDGKERTFKRAESSQWVSDEDHCSYHEEFGRGGYDRHRNPARAYDSTDDSLARLESEYIEAKQRDDVKREQQEAKRRERERRLADELKEVKNRLGSTLLNAIVRRDTMPDGSRCYLLDAPVKPEYAERKGGYERLIIRLKDVKTPNWKVSRETGEEAYDDKVEMAYTYFNGSSSSFASVSTQEFNNDEDAIWEALRSQYHSW